MSKSRIVKYNTLHHNFFEADFYPYPVAYQIFEWGFSGRDFPETGKISLSVKYKKKRVLLSGKIDCKMESSCDGLYYTYFFIPNDIEKMKRYLSLIVQ